MMRERERGRERERERERENRERCTTQKSAIGLKKSARTLLQFDVLLDQLRYALALSSTAFDCITHDVMHAGFVATLKCIPYYSCLRVMLHSLMRESLSLSPSLSLSLSLSHSHTHSLSLSLSLQKISASAKYTSYHSGYVVLKSYHHKD